MHRRRRLVSSLGGFCRLASIGCSQRLFFVQQVIYDVAFDGSDRNTILADIAPSTLTFAAPHLCWLEQHTSAGPSSACTHAKPSLGLGSITQS